MTALPRQLRLCENPSSFTDVTANHDHDHHHFVSPHRLRLPVYAAALRRPTVCAACRPVVHALFPRCPPYFSLSLSLSPPLPPASIFLPLLSDSDRASAAAAAVSVRRKWVGGLANWAPASSPYSHARSLARSLALPRSSPPTRLLSCPATAAPLLRRRQDWHLGTRRTRKGAAGWFADW